MNVGLRPLYNMNSINITHKIQKWKTREWKRIQVRGMGIEFSTTQTLSSHLQHDWRRRRKLFTLVVHLDSVSWSIQTFLLPFIGSIRQETSILLRLSASICHLTTSINSNYHSCLLVNLRRVMTWFLTWRC